MKNRAEKFNSKYEINPASGCWEWLDVPHHSGYGHFFYNGKIHLAHRMAFEYFKGAIAEGLQLDHLCRNRSCVNPNHLEPVTCRENLLRGTCPTAQNARKTHCPKGHELVGHNLMIWRGKRKCRTCSNERALAQYYKNRDAYCAVRRERHRRARQSDSAE